MEKIRLTGISLGYDNNLIYECSSPDVMEEFKAYLDPSEVKRVDKAYLWFDLEGRSIFVIAEPKVFQECNDEWIVRSDDIREFSFRHSDSRNLLDEIEEQLLSVHVDDPR